jgi:Domain of unknown function (DUF4105)
MTTLLDWILTITMLLTAAGITLWTAGAIYYDVCRSARWGLLLVLGWVGGVIVLFAAWHPLWQPFIVLLGFTAFFLAWWLRQKPSHIGDWVPAVAVLPRAVREGDVVTLENIRNFEYRSLDDFTPKYETRTLHLANLHAVDIIFFYWGSSWMSHPVLVFDFGVDGRVCMSIEVRYRKGDNYSVVRGLYRQHELIFIAADERDIILRRTKYGKNEQGYLYRFSVSAELVRSVFLDYVEAINNLYDKPRWYHALCTNCTTSFYQFRGAKCRCDWRVLANGRLDAALYEAGRLDRSIPFPELRRKAHLNEVANAAPDEGFGDHIRRELEKRRLERS